MKWYVRGRLYGPMSRLILQKVTLAKILIKREMLPVINVVLKFQVDFIHNHVARTIGHERVPKPSWLSGRFEKNKNEKATCMYINRINMIFIFFMDQDQARGIKIIPESF